MSIGDLLREAREAHGHTLEDVEKATRIRLKYLEALEADDFAALPSATQARGFLRNYAQFLELDAESLLARYNDAIHKRSFLPRPKPAGTVRRELPAPGRLRSRRLRLFSPDVLVAVVATLGLGALLLWGGAQLAAGLAATPPGGAPAAATGARAPATIAPGGAPTVTPLPVEASPTPPLPTPLPNYTGVDVIVRAEQRIWLRITLDGVEAFVGLMRPGDSKEFVGQQVVEIVTGNGLGTRVIWNGRDQGALGEIGEVVDRLWTREGMVIPTPTITPTPSETPTPSKTPTP